MINRREFISLTGATAAGLMLPELGIAQSSKPNRPPNIVLILADDLGYCDTNLYECRDVKTPHIHSIAENGVSFTDGHVSAPLCSPSRAGLLTGRYQNRFGFEYNAGGAARAHRLGLGLPVSELTIADHLRKSGYATACIGKWHQGSQSQFYPTNRGFDEFYGFLTGAHLYIDPTLPGVKNNKAGEFRRSRFTKEFFQNWRKRVPIMRGEKPADEQEYLTDAFTREALDFIDRKKDQPFFLYLPYNAPHTPLQTTKKYYDRFPHIKDEKSRIYAAMVSAVDDGVGEVLKKLKDTGLEENTMVIFLSDNGCAMYTQACSNDPLRQGKLWLLEGGTRVPFALQYPAAITKSQVYQKPVTSLDILPTAAKLANMDLPTDIKFDGVDLMPYLTGKNQSAPHDLLFCRHGFSKSVRQGNWKLFQNTGHNWLFDLDADLEEQQNLVSKHPDKLKELLGILTSWESEMIEPLWEPKKTIPAILDDVRITLCV